MSRKKEDLCIACPPDKKRYAVGCEPLVLPDGSRMRQLQRDVTKRFCHYHMPENIEKHRVNSRRHVAGLPPLPKHVPTTTLPRAPRLEETELRDTLHFTTPTISNPATPAVFAEAAAKVTSNQSRVINVRWELKSPPETFFREGELHHAAILVGIRQSDGARIRAVKFRRSRACDAIWLWREEGRDSIFSRWASRMPHVNALVWQWGLIESMLTQKQEVA